MKSVVVLMILSAAILAGCGDKHWSKQGASADDFGRDSWDCAQKAAKADRDGVDKNMWRACMMGHGYQRVYFGKWEGIRD